MLSGSVPASLAGCPISRSFFARCGIPQVSPSDLLRVSPIILSAYKPEDASPIEVGQKLDANLTPEDRPRIYVVLEDNPMRFSFRNLVLSSAALCATAAFAAEQRRVEVPFSFVAKNHTYHAGLYTVGVDVQRSVVKLSEVGGPSQSLMWILGPGAVDSDPPKVSLTFDVSGQEHFLRTIQYGTFATPNLNKQPKYKVEGSTTVGE
jgi:hypothetical protein